MSDQESNRIRRIAGWSIIGLVAAIGISIALSAYFFQGGLEHSYHFTREQFEQMMSDLGRKT